MNTPYIKYVLFKLAVILKLKERGREGRVDLKGVQASATMITVLHLLHWIQYRLFSHPIFRLTPACSLQVSSTTPTLVQ